jgi:hypothetical protein
VKRRTAAAMLLAAAAITGAGAEQRRGSAARDTGAVPLTLHCDLVRVPAKAMNGDLVRALEPLHTMEAVIALFQQRKIDYRRTRGDLEFSSLPAETRNQINRLPPGEPMVFPIDPDGSVPICSILPDADSI